MRLQKTEFWLTGCGLMLLALTIAGIFLPQPVIGVYGIGYGAALDHFVALTVGQGVIYLAAVMILLKNRTENLWLILAFALALRLPCLVTPPFLSSDIFRYIWDGWVQAAGINPYRYIPAAPQLAFLRDHVVYPNINRASYAHTIYPPAAEMFFAAASQVTAFLKIPPVLGMKLFMLACEATAAAAIIRLLDVCQLPRTRILIYAWNPLPIWEFTNNGHVDAIAIPLIALALLFAAQQKTSRAAITLAAAVLTKFLPLLLLPAIWRRWDWKFLAIFAATICLFYLPYLNLGSGVFGFLSGYGTQEGISTGTGIFLLSALGELTPLPAFAAKIYLATLAILLLALAAAISRKTPPTPRLICRAAASLAGAAMLGLSPHYPWYYAWLLIPTCIWPSTGLLYLASFSFLLYLNPTHTKLFWPATLYLPFMALALRDILTPRATPMNGLQLAEGRKI